MKMKNWLGFILLVMVSSVAVPRAHAVEATRHDTVYFYDNWEQMINMAPCGLIVDPLIEAYTPYEVMIMTGDDILDAALTDKHIAATVDESIWLINSAYLKREFKGDTKKLNGYMPVFFNDKVAFVMYVGYGDNLSLKQILYGDVEVDYEELVDFYYIDFLNRKVLKVTPTVLSSLLEDYHDLQMRYEGMKDYKKRYIIEDYFYKFIDRASNDIMRPYILDLVDGDGSAIN
jgi:hypothetical protein